MHLRDGGSEEEEQLLRAAAALAEEYAASGQELGSTAVPPDPAVERIHEEAAQLRSSAGALVRLADMLKRSREWHERQKAFEDDLRRG
jgi:hypothetical protein